MRVWLGRTAPVCLAVLTLLVACSPAPIKRPRPSGTTTPTNGSGGSLNLDPSTMPDIMCDPKQPGSPCSPDAPAPPGCGDGVLTPDEACDDGNTTANDGCQANCLAVDPGYSCNPPGQACHELVVCGDSIVGSSEQCDDGNKDAGDGCSAHCNFEIGYKCESTPSVCSMTVCGDGKQEGAESCDDGNDKPFDGCSSFCQTEPTCTGAGCTSICGDGLVIDEECDDGNTKDGDGCSHDCKKEAGFTCSQDADCEKINGACILRVPALFRDFNAAASPGGHPDFQVSCGGESVTTGLVKPDLDADGKPQLVADGVSCITNAASFKQWYTDSDKSHAIVGDIVLFKKAMGTGYVNRWGAMGEEAVDSDHQRTNGASQQLRRLQRPPVALAPTIRCRAARARLSRTDGTPFFFPLDNAPDALMGHTLRGQGRTRLRLRQLAVGKRRRAGRGQAQLQLHDRSEVLVSSTRPPTPRTLDFTGDDDVWVVHQRQARDRYRWRPPAQERQCRARPSRGHHLRPDRRQGVRDLDLSRRAQDRRLELPPHARRLQHGAQRVHADLRRWHRQLG